MLFTYQTPTYLPRIRILRQTDSKKDQMQRYVTKVLQF